MDETNAGDDGRARIPGLFGLRVLIVEDQSINAKFLAVVLRERGCDVESVPSSEEALVLLPVFRPQVVILDLALPLMSNIMLAAEIKADRAGRDAFIVGVSALHGSDVERLARTAGCAAFLRKPLDPFTFPTFLRTQLSSARLAGEEIH